MYRDWRESDLFHDLTLYHTIEIRYQSASQLICRRIKKDDYFPSLLWHDSYQLNTTSTSNVVIQVVGTRLEDGLKKTESSTENGDEFISNRRRYFSLYCDPHNIYKNHFLSVMQRNIGEISNLVSPGLPIKIHRSLLPLPILVQHLRQDLFHPEQLNKHLLGNPFNVLFCQRFLSLFPSRLQ